MIIEIHFHNGESPEKPVTIFPKRLIWRIRMSGSVEIPTLSIKFNKYCFVKILKRSLTLASIYISLY